MSFSIIGTGSALPVQTKTNKELSQLVETNDEWIKTRTGIEQAPISAVMRHCLIWQQLRLSMRLKAPILMLRSWT